MLLVGTDDGLLDIDASADHFLVHGRVVDLAGWGSGIVVLLDNCRVVELAGGEGGTPARVAVLGELDATDGQSVAVLGGDDLVVGRRGAHLVRLRGGRWEPIPGFDGVPGRARWKNPAGPAPDSRSLAAGTSNRIGNQLWINVHVGGLWWSGDGGMTWHAAIEPAADVHEVAADADGRIAVAAAIGFGWSTDAGQTWSWNTDGLHASYARGVAVDGDTVLVSASTGPYTNRAAVYRGALGQPFERCQQGLPEWFGSNVDTGSLSLSGARAAIGTADGTVYVSADRGASWDVAATGLAPIRHVALR